jgi:hypothetical protein
MAQAESVIQNSTSMTLRLASAERLMVALVLLVGCGAVAVAVMMGRVVNWPPFMAGIAATLAMVAIGAYVRGVKQAHRLALGTIGVGLFMGFTAVSTLFVFALFPLPNPLIDETLITIDHRLGYDWPAFVTALAAFPRLSWVLGLVYHSSLPQIVILTITLAALARETVLHRLLLVGMVTLFVAIAFWWVWPSVGPSGFQSISEPVRLATGLYFDQAYGAYLRFLVETGPHWISPEVVTGVVAFPSYHMIMACMVVWYSRRTVLFLPAVVLNALMVPAILSHGGHHLVDLVAGVVVFAVCAWGVARLVPAKAVS